MSEFEKDYQSLKYIIKNNGLENSLTHIDNMLIKYPKNGALLLKKAHYYCILGDYLEAENLYKYIIENGDKAYIYALCNLFEMYIDQKRIEEAELIFERIPKEKITKYEYIYLKSILLRSQKQYKEASTLLVSAIKYGQVHILPSCLNEAKTHYSNYFKKKNYDILKSAALKLSSQSSGNRKIKYMLYLAKLEQIYGNFQEALGLYRAIERSKNQKFSNNAIIGICKTYMLMGNTDLLDSVDFEKLKKCNSSDSFFLLAKIYSINKNYDKALQLIDKVPESGKMYFEKAKILRSCGKYQESLEFLYKSIETNESLKINGNALFNIIYINITLNKNEEALKLLKTNENLLKTINYNCYCQVYAYLCKKLNLTYDEEYYPYSILQILNYDIDLAVKHIEKHIEDLKMLSEFNDNIPEFMSYLRENLNNTSYSSLSALNVYDVNCTDKNGKNIYTRVVTIPHSKDIITCFVSYEAMSTLDENMIDADYEMEKPKQKVIKRKTQIEKFNQRYGIKGE